MHSTGIILSENDIKVVLVYFCTILRPVKALSHYDV